MLALVLLGVYDRRKELKSTGLAYIKDPVSIGLSMVFFVFAFSFFNSENTQEWVHQVRIKLPFLLLPLAFFFIKKMTVKEHKWLHMLLATVSILSSIPVLYHYFQNQENLVRLISQGHYIPTPIDHIHYSIILAYACGTSLLFLSKTPKLERIFFGIAATLLIVILHILAVRTGLVILYLSILFVVGRFVLQQKNLKTATIALVVAFSLPIIAYKTMPSLKQKIDYMLYDLEQYKAGKGKDHSDSERLMSYSIALDLFKEEPVIGHGIGDLKALMKAKHLEKYGEKEKYIYPHNQFLYVLVCVGSIGFVLFFIGLAIPFWYNPNAFMGLIYIAMFTSFLVENTVQRAVSIAFFLFFIFWNSKPFRTDQTS